MDVLMWTYVHNGLWDEVLGELVQAGLCGDHDMIDRPDPTTGEGRYLIHYAVASGDEEVVKKVLKGGASVMVQDRRGKSPLELAMDLGHFEIHTLLEQAEKAELEQIMA